MTNKSERQFAAILEKSERHYIYQPRSSKLWAFGYIPDFYVIGENTFYEVVGTRQAYSQNYKKIERAQGLVKLEIVRPDGTKYNGYGRRGKNNKTDRIINEHILIDIKSKSKSYLFVDFDWQAMMDDLLLEPGDLASLLEITEVSVRNYIEGGRIRKKLYQLLKRKGYSIDKYLLKEGRQNDSH